MKLFEQEHMYQYDWGTVTTAFLQKYPNNAQNHIKSIDVIDRCIDAKEQTLRMRRVVHLQYFIPKLFRNLLNIDGRGVGIEDIDINLREKKLTVSTVNYTLTPLVNLTEKCVYLQKAGNEPRGAGRQNGRAIKRQSGGAIINTVREKSKQGINIMNETIKRVTNENVNVKGSDVYAGAVEKGKK
ncbi:MSF1-like protein, putative [Plasmodium vivax]|uniref:(malaria parasite P. vivax) hypothetical protein n=1 Tax=Plasmodium vivax TaxID=5855 RepID=A0A1G4HGU5_PLAVI|nr:unnamed protein product [Plasmodium vivax]CAI7722112.1 PRELI domain-containing protein, putative [Plasmodium vivax]SCO74144.1 MSF1-like protein, putative [Plasmodium vivax]